MEFSWTTFILEIINFLILVWILKRFLYKPIMEAIGRRKVAVEKTLLDAHAAQTEAGSLKQEYEDRLAVWNQEKDAARRKMVEEINAERARLLADVRRALDEEREREQVLQERRQEEIRRRMEDDALAAGRTFAAKLLSRLSVPDLEARLLELVREDLPKLPEAQRQAIRSAAGETDSKVAVTSAFSMKEDQRAALERVLNEFLGRKGNYEFVQDAALLAGFRIAVGPWVLRANLSDELGFFSEGVRRVE